MKTGSGSKLSVPRKSSSSSVSNQHTRAGSTANKDVQGIKKLDTNIFESYIRVLWEKIPEERRFSCTCADSMWFDMYFQKKYRHKVLRAISRIKIFTNRYVFIPICQFNHWNLLILCNLGEDISSETKSPCILLLDSLPQLTGGDFEEKVREFLMDLYANEKREVSEDSINRIPLKVPNVPQQQDGIRCGYYVLFYIYRFLMCCPDEFNISEHYPGFLKKDWFSRNEIDSFCENLLSLDNETGICNYTCSESSAASESSGVQIIDDLHTGMEVDYPVKVDNGDNNETEMDKDDDEKQEQKDTGNNGLEKNNENNSPKAHNTDRSESPAAYDKGYRKTHKKCDAPVAPKKKSSKNFGRKGSDQKTVQKPRRVWNTSPSSDSDTLEPPLKRCTGKDCGNKAKKDTNASLDTNGRLLDESTSTPTDEEPIQREISASSGISIFVDFTQYGPLPFIRRP